MVTITQALPNDVQALAELLLELDRFYGEEVLEPADTKARYINNVLFGRPPAAHALLAWEGSELAGLAAYSFLWPSLRAAKALYLKELYVRQDHRGQGIGRLLMRHLFRYAADSGCSRMEWTIDRDNVDGQRFYESVGIPAIPSKVFYRAENLDALATTLGG